MNELSKIILVITLLAVIVGMSLLANQAGTKLLNLPVEDVLLLRLALFKIL